MKYLDINFWRYALRDPLTWMALAVDIVPAYMVIMHGWGATALVLLYWCENLVIGLATILRIGLSSVISAGAWGILMAAFLCGFFTLHYGLFCFGHGVFIFALSPEVSFDVAGPPSPQTMMNMVNGAIAAFPLLQPVLLVILTFQLIVVAYDYWPTRNVKHPQPMEEMFSPYGRIIVLHIGVFAGAFALIALDDPMMGVLGLIVFRMVFSVIQRSVRDKKGTSDEPLDPFAPVGSKE